jgi:hypothetical protein
VWLALLTARVVRRTEAPAAPARVRTVEEALRATVVLAALVALAAWRTVADAVLPTALRAVFAAAVKVLRAEWTAREATLFARWTTLWGATCASVRWMLLIGLRILMKPMEIP